MMPSKRRSVSTRSYPEEFHTSGTGGLYRESASKMPSTKGVAVMKLMVCTPMFTNRRIASASSCGVKSRPRLRWLMSPFWQ